MDYAKCSPAVKRVLQDLPWDEVFQPSKAETLYLQQSKTERPGHRIHIERRTDLEPVTK